MKDIEKKVKKLENCLKKKDVKIRELEYDVRGLKDRFTNRNKWSITAISGVIPIVLTVIEVLFYLNLCGDYNFVTQTASVLLLYTICTVVMTWIIWVFLVWLFVWD